ncbi:MAG: methionine--tRNA ligase [Patescibacteria group bacterium]
MKNFYITTSLPYVNAAPHVGFAMEAIEADALARFHKQRGFTVRLQTGTDEHGLKIQKTAIENSTTPEKLTAENSAKFRGLKSALDFDFDDFIRTSDSPQHAAAAQKLWQKIAAAGKLEKRKYAAKYCAGCEEFKSEKDLVDGHCPNHPNLDLEDIEEENYFFRLSDFSAQILAILGKKVEILPHFRAKEFLNVVKEGLHDISFSRSSKKLKWGIPVPGDASQTMYVWCDALTNYISAIDFANEGADFQKWWLDAEKIHIIGKDIVRFHAGIWLGMLLAADVPLPDKIYIHGFITSEGEKMSKSRGNVVDPFEISKEWGSDALRFYLLSEIPNGQDGDFSQTRFEEVYNSQLANGLGNLVSRVIILALKLGTNLNLAETKSSDASRSVEKMWQQIENSMSGEFDFRESLRAIFDLVEFANKFIADQKPWELKDGDEKEEKVTIYLSLLFQIALALKPFLPKVSQKIAQSLGVSLEGNFDNLKKWGAVSEFKLTKPEILFPKKA